MTKTILDGQISYLCPMKSIWKRFQYYGIGLTIGLLFTFIFFQNRGCSWLPENRVKNAILDNVIVFKTTDIEEMKTKGLEPADFIEILQYAAERHIEVIPEIDLPGHARAAIVAMKARYNRLMAEGKTKEATQYLLSDPDDTSVYLSVQNYNDNSANVCLPSTYAFIEKVLS